MNYTCEHCKTNFKFTKKDIYETVYGKVIIKSESVNMGYSIHEEIIKTKAKAIKCAACEKENILIDL